MRAIRTAGIVGLGTMGAGIAQLFVQAGVDTIVHEITPDLGDRARAQIAMRLQESVERERLTPAQRDRALASLRVASELADLAGCDLVAEAVVEDLTVKRQVFRELERVVASDCILATNTSALSVNDIAAALEHPGRVVGMHFFNPAPVLPLVEIVRAELSEAGAVEAAFSFAERLGKKPIHCRDTPGFVVNRILIPVLSDAVRVLDEGTASIEDIDAAMTLGTNWPIGPLALIDLIGTDVHLSVAEALWRAFDDPRFAPPPRIVGMVEAGLLGRKSGRGFYSYDV